MKIFLAGCGYVFGNCDLVIELNPKYVLQSFYYLRKFKNLDKLMRFYNEMPMFLLDSGAFTFMNTGGTENIKKYLEEYINFINKYDIKYFFELDLYTVIGIEKTYEMTRYLEQQTGKKSIPVFHACLGLKRYREMCENYEYVAIGASGLTEECRWVKNDKILKTMVDICHSYGTKIHGLGYTRLDNINNPKIMFDTVDSSSCVSGGRFGTLYYIQNGKMQSKSVKKDGQRIKDLKTLDIQNFKTWVKFQNMKG